MLGFGLLGGLISLYIVASVGSSSGDIFLIALVVRWCGAQRGSCDNCGPGGLLSVYVCVMEGPKRELAIMLFFGLFAHMCV